MQKLALGLALSVLLGSTAMAQVTANSGAGASSNAGAAAITGPQNQGQGQSQSNNITTTLSHSTNTKSVDRSTTEAEPAIAPNLSGLVATPATCMGSASLSGAGGGIFAFGIGGTYRDVECEKREALKLAAQLGLKDMAVRLFMSLDAVRALDAPVTPTPVNHTLDADSDRATMVERPTLSEWLRGSK